MLRNIYSSLGLLFLFLGLPLWASADDLCKRQPIDPESPPGFAGAYEVIGKDPVTGNAYAGTLVIDYQKTTYSLTRNVNGKVVKGEGWIEECGRDRLVDLTVHYSYKHPMELHCVLGADGGNYYRVTCRSHYREQPQQGLEAWFQRQ